MKKQYIIPVFIPYLEKTESILLNQEEIYGQIEPINKEEVKKAIEEGLAKKKEQGTSNRISFLGSNFTLLEESKQTELLEIAYQYVKEGKVQDIAISTKPQAVQKDTIKRLKKYKVKSIELEAQSMNNYILGKIKVGYTYDDIKRVAKLMKWNGMQLGFNMSVGLPDSTRLDDHNTAKELLRLRPKSIRIYPVLVMKHTKLEEDYQKGDYEPLSVIQATERCKELVYVFHQKKVDSICIGLQNMDKILDNGKAKIVGGPCHPAFGQLVESSIWYDSIVDKIKKLNIKVKVAELQVNPKDVENATGYQEENILKLRDTYDVNLTIQANQEIVEGKSEIKVVKTYDDFLPKEDEITK